MKLLSILLLVAIAIVAVQSDCGCLKCCKNLRVASPPNHPVKLIYRGTNCGCSRTIPYKVEKPIIKKPCQQLRTYLFNCHQIEIPRPPQDLPAIHHSCSLQKPKECDCSCKNRLFTNLIAKTDRIVIEAPREGCEEEELTKCAPAPIFEPYTNAEDEEYSYGPYVYTRYVKVREKRGVDDTEMLKNKLEDQAKSLDLETKLFEDPTNSLNKNQLEEQQINVEDNSKILEFSTNRFENSRNVFEETPIRENEDRRFQKHEETPIRKSEENYFNKQEQNTIQKNEEESSINKNEETRVNKDEECPIHKNEESKFSKHEGTAIDKNDERMFQNNEETPNEETRFSKQEQNRIRKSEEETSINKNEESRFSKDEECSTRKTEEGRFSKEDLILKNEETRFAKNEESTLRGKEETKCSNREENSIHKNDASRFEETPFGKIEESPFGEIEKSPFSKIEESPFGKIEESPFSKNEERFYEEKRPSRNEESVNKEDSFDNNEEMNLNKEDRSNVEKIKEEPNNIYIIEDESNISEEEQNKINKNKEESFLENRGKEESNNNDFYLKPLSELSQSAEETIERNIREIFFGEKFEDSEERDERELKEYTEELTRVKRLLLDKFKKRLSSSIKMPFRRKEENGNLFNRQSQHNRIQKERESDDFYANLFKPNSIRRKFPYLRSRSSFRIRRSLNDDNLSSLRRKPSLERNHSLSRNCSLRKNRSLRRNSSLRRNDSLRRNPSYGKSHNSFRITRSLNGGSHFRRNPLFRERHSSFRTRRSLASSITSPFSLRSSLSSPIIRPSIGGSLSSLGRDPLRGSLCSSITSPLNSRGSLSFPIIRPSVAGSLSSLGRNPLTRGLSSSLITSPFNIKGSLSSPIIRPSVAGSLSSLGRSPLRGTLSSLGRNPLTRGISSSSIASPFDLRGSLSSSIIRPSVVGSLSALRRNPSSLANPFSLRRSISSPIISPYSLRGGLSSLINSPSSLRTNNLISPSLKGSLSSLKVKLNPSSLSRRISSIGIRRRPLSIGSPLSSIRGPYRRKFSSLSRSPYRSLSFMRSPYRGNLYDLRSPYRRISSLRRNLHSHPLVSSRLKRSVRRLPSSLSETRRRPPSSLSETIRLPSSLSETRRIPSSLSKTRRKRSSINYAPIKSSLRRKRRDLEPTEGEFYSISSQHNPRTSDLFYDTIDWDHVFPQIPLFYFINAPIRMLKHFHNLKHHFDPIVGCVPNVIDTSAKYFVDFGEKIKRHAMDFGDMFVQSFSRTKRSFDSDSDMLKATFDTNDKSKPDFDASNDMSKRSFDINDVPKPSFDINDISKPGFDINDDIDDISKLSFNDISKPSFDINDISKPRFNHISKPRFDINDISKPSFDINHIIKPSFNHISHPRFQINDISKPSFDINDISNPSFDVNNLKPSFKDISKQGIDIHDISKQRFDINHITKPSFHHISNPSFDINDISKPSFDINDISKPTFDVNDLKQSFTDISKPGFDINDISKPSTNDISKLRFDINSKSKLQLYKPNISKSNLDNSKLPSEIPKPRTRRALLKVVHEDEALQKLSGSSEIFENHFNSIPKLRRHFENQAANNLKVTLQKFDPNKAQASQKFAPNPTVDPNPTFDLNPTGAYRFGDFLSGKVEMEERVGSSLSKLGGSDDGNHGFNPEKNANLLKREVSNTLNRIQALIHTNFEPDVKIASDLLKLQYLKDTLVTDWKRIIDGDSKSKMNLLYYLKELEKYKDAQVKAITSRLQGKNLYNRSNLLKSLIKLYKLQNVFTRIAEDFGQKLKTGSKFNAKSERLYIERLEKLELTEISKHNIENDLKAIRDSKLEQEMSLLERLKKLLDHNELTDDVREQITSTVRLIQELYQIRKLQAQTTRELSTNSKFGVSYRKELKTLYDLEVHLEDVTKELYGFEEEAQEEIVESKANNKMSFKEKLSGMIKGFEEKRTAWLEKVNKKS